MPKRYPLVPVVVLALAFAVPAAAQAPRPGGPPPPECKNLPNGGKIKIPGAVVSGPVACQSCVGNFPVPPNSAVGFSDNSHATCEFKAPSGENTNQCRKETTCPPGATRVQRNGVFVCESRGPDVEFTCPAPPRIPDPPPGAQACMAAIKSIEGQLTASAKTFATAVGNSLKGSNPGSIGGAGVQAAAMMGVYAAGLSGTFVMVMTQKAICNNVDPNNSTSVNDCRAATSDLRTAQERTRGVRLKLKDAIRITKREIREAIASGRQDLKTAGDGLDAVADSAEKAADVCMAEVSKLAP